MSLVFEYAQHILYLLYSLPPSPCYNYSLKKKTTTIAILEPVFRCNAPPPRLQFPKRSPSQNCTIFTLWPFEGENKLDFVFFVNKIHSKSLESQKNKHKKEKNKKQTNKTKQWAKDQEVVRTQHYQTTMFNN